MLCTAVTVSLLLGLAAGRSAIAVPEDSPGVLHADNGQKLVCYYTPTGYFPASKVPSKACTHLIYAFGRINSDGSGIVAPTPGVKSIWATLTGLRRANPQLKVLLSLQQGFPNVVGPDQGKMQRFADSSVAFLRLYGFDGVDMDWEYPAGSQRAAFAQFFTIMRGAMDKDSKARGKPALLLSLALPNNQNVASRSYDLPTIAGSVDFATVMAYDFHVYTSGDTKTGYNSPLYTPTGEYKYFSASAMATYYLTGGFPGPKLLLGIPTYGRSWALASPSSHGLHSQAVGKGAPGPYRHLTGVYTYPDVCVALSQGAQSVRDTQAGAVYLYNNSTWVAYDDIGTVTAKVMWARNNKLGGVGVWAMHLDDIGGVCSKGSLPLITAMGQAQEEAQQGSLPSYPTTLQQDRDIGTPSHQHRLNRGQYPDRFPSLFPHGSVKEEAKEERKEDDSSLVLHVQEEAGFRVVSKDSVREDMPYGAMPHTPGKLSFVERLSGLAGAVQRPGSQSNAVVLMENVDTLLED